jgi:hypothetical protein
MVSFSFDLLFQQALLNKHKTETNHKQRRNKKPAVAAAVAAAAAAAAQDVNGAPQAVNAAVDAAEDDDVEANEFERKH